MTKHFIHDLILVDLFPFSHLVKIYKKIADVLKLYRDIKSDKMARVFKDPFLKRKRFDFEDKTNLTHNRYPLQFENSEFFC